MTAKAYCNDLEYQSFIDEWYRRWRAPLEFADWLASKGLETQAAAVRWAHNTQGRFYVDDLDGGYWYINPKPGLLEPNFDFYWFTSKVWGVKLAHHLPDSVFRKILAQQTRKPTYIESITNLLDCWYLGAENEW